jgi:hypothetical protein
LIMLPIGGYSVSTFLAAAYLIWLMDERRVWMILGLPLVLTLSFYFTFTGLQVPLPESIFPIF